MRGILGTVAALVTATGATAQQPAGELKMGMLQGMFRDVKPVMVQALSKPFRELMLKQTGYTGEVEICADAFGLTEKLKDKSLHIGVFHGFEFAWARTKCPDLVPLIVTRPLGGKVQAVVVVAKDSPYTTLTELKDEPVTLPRGSKAHSIAYLEKLRAGFETGTAKPVTKLAMTAEDVLTGVVTGEVSAALVDVCALEGYQNLQPGAFKQLRVLHRSEEFPAAVVAYRKGTITEAEAARIRTGLSTAQKTASGKLLMTLWNLNGFEEPPAEYQGQLDAILKAYPCPATGDPTAVRAGENRARPEK
jgi:ABC-type phosphate/phosphonate transport system substrate-binding protein